MADGCIFCKIIRGEVPGMKVYEDEHALAFMDVAQDVDGHTLVVPKRHAESLLDCDADSLHRVADAVQKVARHYVDDCGYGGVNLYNCTGACAGQTVPHFHIHIVPRRDGDGVQGWPQFGGAAHEAAEVFQRLRMQGAGGAGTQ